ncbi:MAG: efflux RND transporter permease subunit, partial [Synechococcales cyanobacterium RM1_1_8]|nr:efflux RND transporter permease subunit [Synechococcales cyanobacterium RM1_1_8]
RQHIGTAMLCLAIVVLGLFALTRLPVDLLPSITYPRIGLRVDAPGLVPRVAVDEVTRPLEEALAVTPGVTQIFSQTREGRAQVDLYFEPGSDVNQALNDATAALNRVRDRLPDTIGEPRLFKFDPSQLPVYEIALTSASLPDVALRIFSDEELSRELARVPGVATVDISGGVEEEVQINLDLQRMRAAGIDIATVAAALGDRNQDISGGLLRGGSEENLTRLVGKFQSVEDIANLKVGPATRQVRLRTIADIVDGTQEQRVFVSLNGQPAVKVSIQKQPDANTVTVVDGVKAKLEQLKTSGLIPADMVITATLDESRFVRSAIQNVAMAGLSGAGLAAIAVLAFLGSLRQTLIILIAIPLAVLAALILMSLFGLSLNIFSLGGLAMGVGIVVDNSIVMLENIAQAREAGAEPLSGDSLSGNPLGNGNGSSGLARSLGSSSENFREAASPSSLLRTGGLRGGVALPLAERVALAKTRTDPSLNLGPADPGQLGRASGATVGNGLGVNRGSDRRRWRQLVELKSQELESALLASTTTNLVVVIPFLLVGGFLSLLFSELILTISFAVAGSLLVALTVVPMLASQLLSAAPQAQAQAQAQAQTQRPSRNALSQGFNHGVQAITRAYGRLLGQILRFNWLAIALSLALCTLSSGWLFERIPQEILPRINTGQASLRVQFPPGTSAAQNRRVMAAIDQALLSQPEVRETFTTAGGGLFGSSTSVNALRGSSTINFQPEVDPFAWIDRANGKFRQLPLIGTRIRLSPESVRGLVLNNSPVRGDVDVVLQGEDSRLLEQAGQQVVEALGDRATLAEYRPDADPPRPETQILPDWNRISTLGLSQQAMGDTLQTVLSGKVPTQLQRGDRLVDINVQLPPGTIQRPNQLEGIPLFTGNNEAIQLGDVARIQAGEVPAEIQRINQRQIYLIEGSLADGASLSQALEELDGILADLELPPGISRLPSAAGQSNRQIQAALRLLGALAAFLVFVVMAVQYNSLVDPLVIMLTVPLALTGGLLGLWLSQTAIGATVIIGAILLVGIVVNNAIILVELANQIRDRQGISAPAAILQAAPQRLRPILMTTLTTVLGLLPLALGIGEGSEFLQPLGVVVFSGLSFATLLTLFVIPCFYTLLHGIFDR